jgi:threonine dehydrogenase-like Zn-dependent dehydrogenase
LPDAIDDEIGAILDPLGNAVHTALSFDLIGEDVLITGAGPIGIMAAAVARHVGARHVVITDINQARLDLAGQVADVVPVNVATTDLKSVYAGLQMTQGFDVGMEMSGSQAALDQMVDHMVMGGRIAMLGIPPGKSPVDWSRIVFKAITIKGVYGREIFETWYKMIAMLENGLTSAASSPTASRWTTFRMALRPCVPAFPARSCWTGPDRQTRALSPGSKYPRRRQIPEPVVRPSRTEARQRLAPQALDVTAAPHPRNA